MTNLEDMSLTRSETAAFLLAKLTPQQLKAVDAYEGKFWENVDVLDDRLACWLWLRSCDKKKGYGHGPMIARARLKPHRLAYYYTFRVWPEDTILHSCDNPPCCNPRHLKDGTQAENMLDMITKGRNSNIVLAPEDALQIRALMAQGHSEKKVAEMYGVHRATINRIKNKKTWTTLLT